MIHAYQYGGYNIVIDIPTGSIHLVDELVYALLQDETDERSLVEHYGREALDSARAEIRQLKEKGLLYSIDQTPSLRARFPKAPLVKAICLHVAHDCNLRCAYCFASTGEYQGSREMMSLETGKKALRFLCEHSGQRHNLEVDFFGGEPLMNFEVVKELVRYGRELEQQYHKNFRFTMTTNGVLLNDEITEYLNREMVNVVLSIDGTRATNDRVRKTLNGQSSYDVIVPKFQEFVKKRGDKPHYVRGTFTAYNLNFAEDLLHLRDLGFRELSMEPVVSTPDKPYAITEEHLPTILRQYEILADELLKKYNTSDAFRFFHFEIDLAGGPCAVKKSSGCGAGTEYLAITPSGELYPCHQFVGDEQFRLGTLDEGITRPDLIQTFGALSVFDKSTCEQCFAKYYCSGGCHANAYQYSGDLKIPFEIACAMERKRVELAIYLAVRKMEVS